MFRELTPDEQTEIDALLASGQKIQAVKRAREATGAGLAEAKAAVDAREVYLRSVGTPLEVRHNGGDVMLAVVVLATLTALIVFVYLFLVVFR